MHLYECKAVRILSKGIAATKGEVDQFAMKCYTDQSHNLVQVLNDQLEKSGGPFLLGKETAIADINASTYYASTHFWAMVPVDGLSHLTEWIALLMNRPSVKAGLSFPFARPGFFGKPYATDEEIQDEIQRNAAMFTKGGGSRGEL
jgi:glutathione S-transferase